MSVGGITAHASNYYTITTYVFERLISFLFTGINTYLE
jgi:hypothetical protein